MGSILGSLFGGPKPPKPKRVYTSQATLAERGSYLPNLVGRRRVAPVVACVGILNAKKHESGGETVGYFYNQSSMHLLCVGPAYKLHRIWQAGKLIYDTPIDRETTVSGTTVDLGDKYGAFYIFWGELNQPVNERLASNDEMGVASRWPGVCYVEWRPKYLKESPTWPEIEYEIEVRPTESPLESSSPWINETVPDFVGTSATCVPINGGAEFAAGDYTVQYLRGALRYDGPGNKWRVNRQSDEGYFIRDAVGGTDITMAPGGTSDYPSQAACEAANAGKTKTFTLVTAKHLSLCLFNSNYDNNFPGAPNPTFVLIAPDGSRYEVTGVAKPGDSTAAQGTGDSGVNVAHLLWRLLTAPYPYGLGIEPAKIDGGSVEAFGATCAAERLIVNMLAEDGRDASDVVGDLISQAGFALAQVADRLVILPIRAPGDDVPTLPPEALVDPLPELTQKHGGPGRPTSVGFKFTDRALAYKQNDVEFSDDAGSRAIGRKQIKSIELPDMTDRRTAYAVARRRAAEELSDQSTLRIRVTRESRWLRPGQAFEIEGVGILRVVDVQLRSDSTLAEITAARDYLYGQDATSYVPVDIDRPDGTPAPDAPAADADFVAVNLPSALAGGSDPAIGVLRIRAHKSIESAEVWIGTSGSTLLAAGVQDGWSAGGVTNRPLLATELDGDDYLDEGPTITSFNDDIQNVLDLTGNDDEWAAGRQLCLIDDEWMYLRKAEAVSGGWKLRGLLRARLGTTAADHPQLSPVKIVKRDDVRPIKGGIVASGATLYVKTKPATAAGAADLSTVTAKTVTVT